MANDAKKGPRVNSPAAAAVAAGEPGQTDPAVIDCLETLKAMLENLQVLVEANNDASALAELILAVQAVCDKTLLIIDQNQELLIEVQDLCQKILQGNESLAIVSAELQALCDKFNSVIKTVTCPEICCFTIRFVFSNGTLTEGLSLETLGGNSTQLAGNSSNFQDWLVSNGYTLSPAGNNTQGVKTGVKAQDLPYFAGAPLVEFPGNGESDFVNAVGTSPGWLQTSNIRGFVDEKIVLDQGGEEIGFVVHPSCEFKDLIESSQPDTSVQEDLLQKLCSTLTDCSMCAQFFISDEQTVDNVISGVQDGSGSIQPLPQPATGPIEFAAQVQALGFVVDSIAGNVVTICGTNLIFSYQLEDGTVVAADAFTQKQGMLTCDPSGTAAICGKLDQVNGNLQTAIALLQKMCCDEEPTPNCQVTLTSDNGTDGAWNWASGPASGQDLEYPTPIDTPEVQDFKTTVTADCAELEQCYPELAEGGAATMVKLRYTFCHEQLGPNHTGFIFVVQGGSAVAVSANNTANPVASNGQNQQIGTASGDPDDVGPQERWVEYLVPKDDLCGEGVVSQSGGFQGFDTGGVFDESLAKPTTVTITGVS